MKSFRTPATASPERCRPSGGRCRALALCALVAAGLVAAPPAAAQEKQPCKDCATAESKSAERQAKREAERSRKRHEELRRAVQRDLEREAARLRRDLARIRREPLQEQTLRALRTADTALASLEPASARSVRALARAEAGLARSAEREPEMEARLARAVEALARMQVRLAQVESAYASAGGADVRPRAAEPQGWMGIGYSGPVQHLMRDGSMLLVHRGYPMVETVEPGSPAAAAGIEAGDTILAYDGRDVRKSALSLTSLLTPGRRVTVKVRRAGTTKTIPVTIRRKPIRPDERWTVAVPLAPLPPEGPWTRVPPGAEPAPRPEATPRVAPTPRPPRAPAVPRGAPAPTPTPAPPTAPAPPATFVFGWGETNLVAGAEVVRMNADLRDAFGGRGGVLVIGVAERSPAYDAGLRGGDVIVRAGGDTVSSPAALQRALRAAKKDRELALEVVRKGKGRVVKLEW